MENIQKKNKKINKLIPLGICFLIVGVHILFLTPQRLARVENIFLDTFFRIRPSMDVYKDIVYIEIAEDSLQVFGRWPFPRYIHAVMVHILQKWQAKAIVFDVVFSEPSNEFDDEAFEEALKGIADSSIKLYLPILLESIGGEKMWIRSLPRFEQHADTIGHIEITPDLDGLVRRIKPIISNENASYSHLALRIASDLLKERGETLNISNIPKDRNGDFIVNWSGQWHETFNHYSYVDVIQSFEAIQKNEKPIISPEQIRNKICIIGVSATGLTDIKATPVASLYPAVGLYGNIVNSILQEKFIHIIPHKMNILILVFLGFLATFLFNPFRNIFSFVMGMILASGWVLTSYIFFTQQGIWLYVFEQLILILILFIFSAMYSFFFVEREREAFYELATHDGLTGLLTIRHFRLLLEEAIEKAAKNNENLGLIIMDIDNFKKFNDAYGHQMGDQVLKTVARIVNSCNNSPAQSGNKNQCVAGRYGGEELIVMIKHLEDDQKAIDYAEWIRSSVEKEQIHFQAKTVSVTLSLGVATSQNNTSAERFIQQADHALYRAKNLGKNRVCLTLD